MEMIKVLRIEPKKKPEVITIENDYKTFRKIIDGYLEAIILSDTALILIDEEGKLKANPVGNRRFRNDIIVGTMLIVGRDEADTTELSPDDIEFYSEYFGEPEEISEREIKEHSGFRVNMF